MYVKCFFLSQNFDVRTIDEIIIIDFLNNVQNHYGIDILITPLLNQLRSELLHGRRIPLLT